MIEIEVDTQTVATFRIEKSLKEQLEEIAARHSIYFSDLVRTAIAYLLYHMEMEPEKVGEILRVSKRSKTILIKSYIAMVEKHGI